MPGLLEREASADAGWLRSLLDRSWSGGGVEDLFDPLEPIRLRTLDAAADRRSVLSRLLQAAAGFLKLAAPRVPPPGESPWFDKRLAEPTWEDPLYLMMAALASVRSGVVDALTLTRTDLALRLADRELDRLSKFLPEPAMPRQPYCRLLQHMAAYVTACGGLSPADLLPAAKVEAAELGIAYPGGPGALADALRGALPGSVNGAAAVLPDIVGEALLLRVFGGLDLASGSAALCRAARGREDKVAAAVTRAVQDFCPAGHKDPLDWLEAMVQTGIAGDLGLLSAVEGAMPEQTLELREKAVEIDLLLVARFSELYSKQPRESLEAELARFRNNLSIRLSALGRREEALRQAEEAVRIRRRLAEARPDAFLPDLATSLNNLANMLSDLGWREEALRQAEEAVRIYSQLAEARPDAFLPGLAMSLNTLANRLSVLGRREEALRQAEEAVRIYGQLAGARPDAFLPDLAMSLNNLANRLSALGRREEALRQAEEAVRIYGQLAEARPDAFLPDLATSLNNLAAMLIALGRREEALRQAEEAVRIRRQLAEARPDAFLPGLARSFGTMSVCLRGLERQGDAASALREAIRILKPYFAEIPQAHAGLMGWLVKAYVEALEAGGLEPDLELVAPVIEVLRSLQKPPPSDAASPTEPLA